MRRAAIYALTPQGARLAAKIALGFGGQIFLPAGPDGRVAVPEQVGGFSPPAVGFGKLSEQLAANFSQFPCHILICASGIAVRCLAPLLAGKERDPAVLLLDQRGEFVISLLSGHLGGANRLARELAAALGATPVITTATDNAGLPAIDELAKDKDLRIVNLKAARAVSAALLRGEKPLLLDLSDRLGLAETGLLEFFSPLASYPDLAQAAQNRGSAGTAILVDPPEVPTLPGCTVLVLESRRIWLGLGCRRGTPARRIEEFILGTLETAGLRPGELAGIASIDLKRDEPGLLEAARRLKLALRFFSAVELDAVDCPNPSELVRRVTGSANVCEAAALLAANSQEAWPTQARAEPPREKSPRPHRLQVTCSRLLLPKTRGDGITLALALASVPLPFPDKAAD